jgi:hypothetical protein
MKSSKMKVWILLGEALESEQEVIAVFSFNPTRSHKQEALKRHVLLSFGMTEKEAEEEGVLESELISYESQNGGSLSVVCRKVELSKRK